MGLLFLLFILVSVLAPIGSMLFIALAIGSFTRAYREEARALLKQASVVGGICAALTVLVFLLAPDLLMPGIGTAAIVLAAFMAGFAGSAGPKVLGSRSR